LPPELCGDGQVVFSGSIAFAKINELEANLNDGLQLLRDGRTYLLEQSVVEAMVVPKEGIAASHACIT